MTNASTSITRPINNGRYFFSPAPTAKPESKVLEALSNAPATQKDEFANLAERLKDNPYAIVVTHAAKSDKGLGLKLDLDSSWNRVALFFKKVISWIKNNASNRMVKEDFVKYILDKLGTSDDAKADGIRKSLAYIVNPASGWPLDLRVVKQFVDEASSYSCHNVHGTTPDQQLRDAGSSDVGTSPINRVLLPEFNEHEDNAQGSSSLNNELGGKNLPR